MASPRENTEVVRMLRDFKAAVSGSNYKKNQPLLPTSYLMSDSSLDSSKIVKKLDFSSISSPSVDPAQSSESMKRKLMIQEMDLLASQAVVKAKESAYSDMEVAKKKVCIGLNQELQESKKTNDTLKQRIRKLTAESKFTQQEVASLKSSVKEVERKKNAEVKKLQRDLLASKNNCSNLKLQLVEVKSDKAEAITVLNSESAKLQEMLMTASEEARTTEKTTSSLKNQIRKLTEESVVMKDLQKLLEDKDKKIKELTDQINTTDESTLIVGSMKNELLELKKENELLKAELAKYKDNNVSLFQEKMWAYQEKLSQSEKKNVEMAILKVENDSLKTKLMDWEGLCGETPQVSKSPVSFSKKLFNYQKNEALLTYKISKLTSSCSNLKNQNSQLKAELKELKSACQNAKEESCNSDSLLKRLKKNLILVSRERDNCRRLIDSYVSEATGSSALLNTTHIKSLESTIADYKNALEMSDKEIEALKEKTKELSECLVNREAEIKKLKEENGKELLVNESRPSTSKLEETKAVTEKVIHLKCNPLSQAIEEHNKKYEDIREENDRLKKRIAILEEEGALSADVTAKVEQRLQSEGSDSLLQELRDRLASSERKMKLILDTAFAKSKEFREGVYILTGYKVDMMINNTYRLSHVFAASPNDHLLFEVNGTDVNVLETPFSHQVANLMNIYLNTHNSVPAFLASVTMHLLLQQTVMETSNIAS